MRRILLIPLLCLFVLSLPAAPAAHATPNMPVSASAARARPHVVAAVSPSCLNDPTISSKVWTVAISDTLAFLGDGRALTILDVSDPARPTCRSHLALSLNYGVTAIEVRGNYAYLALGNWYENYVALQIVDVHDPDNPSLAGSYNAPNASDLAVVGNLVYLATLSDLKIIDVSDPAAPVLAGTYALGGSILQIEGNRLYLLDAYRFDILDLADPIHPLRLGGFPQATVRWYSFSVAGKLVYLLRSAGGGVDVIDQSNLGSPTLIGTYTNIDFLDGYSHPTTHGFRVIDNRLYIADTLFQIYDVSSPTKAQLISSYDAPGVGYDMWLAGGLAYVATPNESGAGDYGLEIIDLSNKATPFLRGWFRNGNTGRFFYMSSIQR